MAAAGRRQAAEEEAAARLAVEDAVATMGRALREDDGGDDELVEVLRIGDDEAFLAPVAEELREWGQSPLGWETFVEDSGDDSLWQRNGYRVLPEAGCAADAARRLAWCSTSASETEATVSVHAFRREIGRKDRASAAPFAGKWPRPSA